MVSCVLWCQQICESLNRIVSHIILFLIIIFACYLSFLPFVVNKDFHHKRLQSRPVHDNQLDVDIFAVIVQKVRHEVGHRLVGDVTTQDDMPVNQQSTATAALSHTLRFTLAQSHLPPHHVPALGRFSAIHNLWNKPYRSTTMTRLTQACNRRSDQLISWLLRWTLSCSTAEPA